MDLQIAGESLDLTTLAGQVLLVETEQAHPSVLEEWVRQTGEEGNRWLLPCDFAEGGPWAGVADLFLDLVPKVQAGAGDLLVRHDYELVSILPALRSALNPRNPSLTDLASATEQVRLYPADRAFRILHGLIDLLAEWKDRTNRAPWLIVCGDFDKAGALARRFFTELMRRRGRSHGLVLVVVTQPGAGADLHKAFAPEAQGPVLSFQNLVQDFPSQPPSIEEPARQAQALEDSLGGDPFLYEAALPRLIHLWKSSSTPEKAAAFQYDAFSVYTSRGFYLDSIAYGEGALTHLENYFPNDEAKRWRIVNKLFACHCATGNPEQALAIVENTLSRLHSPKFRSLAHYVLAMLHSRYLTQKNLTLAVEHLDIGLADLHRSDMPPGELVFQVAFNRNGLAFIRYRQGDGPEAIELCREGYESLRDNLREDQHRLHKSVLLYNIAQVYSSLGQYDEAIAHYTSAMEMDPHYSEYYNERGNLQLKKGFFAEALRDYLCAIEMSPPFPEVHANLGYCYYRMNRFEEALKAYSTSLDLDPAQPELRVMKAQCYEAIERWDEALAEYSESLRLKASQPLVLANRAVLKFQLGATAAALEDLNRAAELDPGNPDLYQNRAVALADLGMNEQAAHDLEMYLNLRPDAEDFPEVSQKIYRLRTHAEGGLSPQ